MTTDDEPEPYAIFLSHSSKDRTSVGNHMRKFVSRFREVVCSKAGIENLDRAVFFDELSIRMGDEWNDALVLAIRTSRMLVCLVSSRFLNSQRCGREVEVFHRRHLSFYPEQAGATGFVFPLIWEVDVREPWPHKLSKFQFREAGIPDITSSHMESTVKEINYRVKGSEKFWSRPGAEALLQLRADQLSDSQPLQKFWETREQTRRGFRSRTRQPATA